MIEVKHNNKERAVLIGLKTKDITRAVADEHLDELEELANTAGAETILKVIQERQSINASLYLGKGKAEEIAEWAELNEADIIIFDDDLAPLQAKNLEKLFDKKVIDRSGLILDIFALRAQTKEAKTQVELAQLEYMLPRLTRAWTHLSKQHGGIGTKGPGETQIETDRRLIRDRIAALKKKLLKIEDQRETQTKQRQSVTRISLAGYTNAGKSTLFNRLTEADAFAENKLFATLDSTTRSLDMDGSGEAIISDTVGFIRKLPPHLVASFKSTLNEVRDADIILHVIDITHPYYEDHARVVEQTLEELDAHEKPRIAVFNKVDALVDKSPISYVAQKYPDAVLISAQRGIAIDKLMEKISGIIESGQKRHDVVLGLAESKKLSQIHELANVLDTKYDEDGIHVSYRADKESAQKIESILNG